MSIQSDARSVEPDPVAVAGWLEVDRLAAEARDLRRRIDRTLDYTDSLLRLDSLSPDLVVILRSVHNSLCTPVARGEVQP